MDHRFLKLKGGQNIRLATISSRLAVLCGNYLLDGAAVSDEDSFILKKGREYFSFVKKGQDIKRKTRGLSFDPETLHFINAYDEVHLVDQNVKKVLTEVEETFKALEGKKEVSPETVVNSFDFFTGLAEKVRASDFHPEANRAL
jgi:hypothetical protein